VPFAGFTALSPLESPYRVEVAVNDYHRPSPSWVFPSPRSARPARCERLVTVAPPVCLSLRPLPQVTPKVRPPAALRSITRTGGGIASLEAAFPS